MRQDVLVAAGELRDYAGPPVVLFVGVSTGGSRVHQAFPAWAPLVWPAETVLRGVDLPEDADPAVFRALVADMTANPRIRGAVVTSHKLRLYRATADLVSPDALVELTHEINALDTSGPRPRAYARDPQSLDLVLGDLLRAETGPRPVVCIGAGGSATALLLAMGLSVPATQAAGAARPRAVAGSLTVVGNRRADLDDLRAVRERCGIEPVDLVYAPDTAGVDAAVAGAAPGSVIANATGLGKTAPGSPISSGAVFPGGAVAWDFNYRGPLTFLDQARRAGVATVDGWDYFVAGWSAALAAIGGAELTPKLFARCRRVVSNHRPPPYQGGALTS